MRSSPTLHARGAGARGAESSRASSPFTTSARRADFTFCSWSSWMA
jgi:hypothetical protein